MFAQQMATFYVTVESIFTFVEFSPALPLPDQNFKYANFMVAACINNIKHFIVQLMRTNCKILRILK